VEQQFVIFNLGGEDYGLEISSVEGIIKMQPITRMPKTPDYVEGVINLRGMVVPVIDLRKRFNLPSSEATKDTRIVNVYVNKTKVGMIVDGVSEVVRLPDEAVEPPPAMVSGVDITFIRGIAKLDDRLITLLDLNRILSTEEQSAIESITSA
jgi:purine-binding chemotaxis protein CheW